MAVVLPLVIFFISQYILNENKSNSHKEKKCVYCGRKKKEADITKEHVIPRAIGGAINSINPFLIDVCHRCNTVAGFHIDSIFVKNWFMSISKSLNAKKFINLEKAPTLPLSYMGKLQDLNFQIDKICEVWLSPSGDVIFHFHTAYPKEDEFPPVVGIHPSIKMDKDIDIDYGFAYIFITANNKKWWPTAFNSFINYFDKSTLYLGNGETPKGGLFSDIPKELEELTQELFIFMESSIPVQNKILIDSDHRFLAKIALGIGAIELDKSFLQSKNSKLLRDFMWTSDSEERKEFPVFGSGLLTAHPNTKELSKIFEWEDGHLLALIEVDKKIVLYTSFYGRNTSIILVSDDKTQWENKFQFGIVYVVVPGLQRVVRLKLEEFMAHKHGGDVYKNANLVALEEEMSKFKELPPYSID